MKKQLSITFWLAKKFRNSSKNEWKEEPTSEQSLFINHGTKTGNSERKNKTA